MIHNVFYLSMDLGTQIRDLTGSLCTAIGCTSLPRFSSAMLCSSSYPFGYPKHEDLYSILFSWRFEHIQYDVEWFLNLAAWEQARAGHFRYKSKEFVFSSAPSDINSRTVFEKEEWLRRLALYHSEAAIPQIDGELLMEALRALEGERGSAI